MANCQPAAEVGAEIDPSVVRLVDAAAQAALDYLCAHADEWPGGRAVAARIARHRRRTAMPAGQSARRAG